MDPKNILGALPTTAIGGVGAGALYFMIAGAKSPETTGDFVVFGTSVIVFLLGALLPAKFNPPGPPTGPNGGA